MTSAKELADRLDATNKRYIRKAECKETLNEAAAMLRRMDEALERACDHTGRMNGCSLDIMPPELLETLRAARKAKGE